MLVLLHQSQEAFLTKAVLACADLLEVSACNAVKADTAVLVDWLWFEGGVEFVLCFFEVVAAGGEAGAGKSFAGFLVAPVLAPPELGFVEAVLGFSEDALGVLVGLLAASKFFGGVGSLGLKLRFESLVLALDAVALVCVAGD